MTATGTVPTPPPPPARGGPSVAPRAGGGPSRGTGWRHLLVRVVGAAVAGLGLYASFPPLGLWWLAPLAVTLLLAVVDGRRPRAALGLAAIFALAYQAPLLQWTGEYVGPVWLLLLVALVVFVAVPVTLSTSVLRLPGAPLWVACVWVAGEALIERWPFEGFPWAKIAFGQPGGVFAPLASLGGAPLVSFATVLTGAGLWTLLRVLVRARGGADAPTPSTPTPTTGRATGTPTTGTPTAAGRRPALVVGVVAVLVGPVAGLATLPATTADTPAPTVTVAAIQGNVPRAGLDFNAQRRAVLDNHVAETRRLAGLVRAGASPRPDLVIWPENSSDIDPFRNADAGAEIQAVTDEIGAPVVVGAVLSGTRGTDGRIVRGPRNASVVWLPGTGPGQSYVKRHILPFGEYIPLRPVARLVQPADVDRVTDFEPGTGTGVLAAGPVRLGVATCYEVVFDGSVRDAVRGGADLLTVPTNNATFGYTDMTYQQQGMSRLRAVEHDRSVVIAATSGQSAVIDPAGRVVARTGALFTPGTLVRTVPLRTTTTLATRVGAAPELVLAGLGVAAVVVAVARRTTSRRKGPGT